MWCGVLVLLFMFVFVVVVKVVDVVVVAAVIVMVNAMAVNVINVVVQPFTDNTHTDTQRQTADRGLLSSLFSSIDVFLSQ